MDFRTRLEQSNTRANDADISAQEEQITSDFFAIDRFRANPVCLDLRLSSGERHALPYAFIMEMSYSQENGITLCTSRKSITITGRNLSELYECLLQYRVRYVQANIGNDWQEAGLFVEGILVENLE